MKKKFIVFLLLLFSFSALGAGAEEDVVLFSMPTPAPAEQTSAPGAQKGEAGGEAEPEATYRPGSLQPDAACWSPSALGDLTFGRDVRKSVDIFDREFSRGMTWLCYPQHPGPPDGGRPDPGQLETTLPPRRSLRKQPLFFSARRSMWISYQGGIEAVSFENNHAMDHGSRIDDTIATLNRQASSQHGGQHGPL